MSKRDCHVAELPESAGILRRIEVLLGEGERTCPHHARAALEAAYAEIKRLNNRVSKKIDDKKGINPASYSEGIVGVSPALEQVLGDMAKVAPTNSTVLITGATGTGKELLARAIHKRSPRSSHAFVPVNCAAIPASLIGSELFGHEKGSFTGAIERHLGRFESADGGTIFLDEVGELLPEAQIALLRVLQEKEIERVGGDRPVQVDVRVLAATNRDLSAAVTAGSFRADLFYRLNVFPIKMPSLCERREDIPLLVEYFVKQFAARAGTKITKIERASLELFESYQWPGNIRELQNVVERAIILSEGGAFSVDPTWIRSQTRGHPTRSAPLLATVLCQEKSLIEAALRETLGRIAGADGAAAKLGIPRTTLESKIKRLEINKHRFKRPVAGVQ
jgi:transcriptional regulator with GAF, ATPase, and Fis domain